ncbi:MAG: PEP-CTERM sorting domain-containing protein [Microcystaceae cyanobacterium]
MKVIDSANFSVITVAATSLAAVFTSTTGGNVTFADAQFGRGNEFLFLGGFGVYIPEIIDFSDFNPNWRNFTEQTTFNTADTATTPESSSVLALLGLGLGVLATKVKKQA